MVARLDAVADDDLDSDFLASAVIEAEDAGARLFDVGIRTLTNEFDAGGKGSASGPAGSPFVGAGSAGGRAIDADALTSRLVFPERAAGAVTVEAEGAELPDFSDPAVRAAFILGGPAAILRRG